MQKTMKSCLAVAALLAFAASGHGATTIVVQGKDVTATQAIIRVTTDQTGFCTYRVSEGSSFTALVNDVNPALFSGSNTDARAGAVITGMDATRISSTNAGTRHVFVAGTRTAARAADGKYYSRSLQTNTLHWAGVTCGTDAEVSTTFQTLNLPLGVDGPELMPFDATAFGNIAVPTIDWSNRSTTYNDPLWGTQLHRMTDAADVAFDAGGQSFTYGVSSNGHWTNPGNATSAGSSSLATCNTSSSCTPGDALTLIAVIPSNVTNYATNGAWDSGTSFVDFLAKVWGSGSDAASANRTVAVCWSIDDQTCFTSTQNIVLPQASAVFAGTAPQSWGVQSPWSGNSATALTSIVVSGSTATVNFAASPGLSNGATICINGIKNEVTTAQGGMV